MLTETLQPLVRTFAGQALACDEQYVSDLIAGMVASRPTLPVDVGAAAAAGDFERAELAARGPVRSSGGTAVLNIMGPLQQRPDFFMLFFGGTSTERLRAEIAAVLGDDSVKSIVLNIDSPGGTVDGTEEAAQAVFEARGRKPITAVANTFMASAAYYIGSQADEVVVTPSGQVGSIGVVQMHMDYSEAFAQAGIKPTVLRAGKFKVESTPFEPLSDAAREHTQSMLEHWYGQFVAAVARGRGVTEAEVRGGFGQGRMEVAAQAVKVGLADRIATLDQVLARHGGNAMTPRSRADVDTERLARVNSLAFAR